VGDAVHFEKGGKACEFRSKRFSRYARESLQIRVYEIGFRQKGAELPGVLDVAGFQPCLNRFFPLDAGELIFILCRLERDANRLLALCERGTVVGTDGRGTDRFT